MLINFRPKRYLQKLFDEPSIANKMYEVVFKSREWILLDEGSLTMKEASDIFCAREPDFIPYIKQIMECMTELLTPVSETIALLPEVKKAGHRLYYLSNYPKEPSLYIQEKYAFFDYFDGGVFSCDVHILKPSPEIYRCLLDKYNLLPQNCVFFDDMDENVKAAENMGIRSILFTGAEDVINYLNK